MEQVQSNVQTAQLSWFGQAKVSVARQLVLAKLQKITDACIEIHEEGSVQLLGCPQASLWGVIDVHDSSMYLDFVKGGSIGAAEAYIGGKWSSPDLTALIQVFARCQAQLDSLEQQKTWLAKYKHQWFHRSKKNSKGQARDNILAHYDLGNQLYTRFLDKQMMYSSAIYSDGADNLEDAQIHKLDTICRRLELKPGEHLIEIGTGWGGLAIHAASKYGCRVTTTTISDAQYEYAKARIAELKLRDKITLLKKDYRDLTGQYDKLVSIEMIEAVGHEYFDTFFNQCNRLLKSGGKMLLQAITIADQRFEHYKNNVDFIQRYIFPGGCLPSIGVLSRHIGKDTDMVIEQLHDIGLHYARTLKDWRERFEANWHQLKALGYDERFKRMWLYYLQYCEGAFLERATSTVHLVARK
jgi:cyclopropane-fatty-acyl-phospholipid synthase